MKIFDGELIAGSLTKHLAGSIFLPEYKVRQIKEEWDEFSSRDSARVIPSDEDKETIFKDVEFWDGKTLFDLTETLYTEKWGTLVDDLMESRQIVDIRGISAGRMIPDYSKLLNKGFKGIIAEILACLWLKLSTIYLWYGVETADVIQTSNFQNIAIGGRNKEGEDESNELSRLIVEVDTALKLRQPTLSLRYHEKTDEALLFDVAEDIRTGGGKPAMFCEDYACSVLLEMGVDENDIHEWTPVGCVEMTVPGKGTPCGGLMVSTPPLRGPGSYKRCCAFHGQKDWSRNG